MKRASAKERQTAASARKAAYRPAKKGRAKGAARRYGAWWWAAAVLLAAACLLRLLWLGLVPLHHDEGVNGNFLTQLFRNGYYHYDPANYHGPTLYYFGLVTTTLNALFYGKYGLSTFAIRLVPAIFGVGIVWLALLLRRHIGNFGSWAAAALLTVSPGMVYFSRYFIHEIPFVFFTLALVVTIIRYRETARPRYLLLASASAALMFATKETCVISFAVLLLAHFCTSIYLRFRARHNATTSAPKSLTKQAVSNAKVRPDLRLSAIAAVVFIVLSVLFFSSFFTNPQGVSDSVRTFGFWAYTGEKTTQYRAVWSTYLTWLQEEELPILILGALGIVIALWQALHRFAVFVSFWALGITAAYSLIPYKTPWVALNLILPLALIAGYGLDQWHAPRETLLRATAVLALLAAVGLSLYQAVDLSFYRYDDDSIHYVYAHTSRQLLDLVAEVDRIATRSPSGKDIGIAIVSPEHWPLPWYFRDYPHATFWQHLVQTSDPILIALDSQVPEVEKTLGLYYVPYRSYRLRPGNVLVLFLRRDVKP